MNQKDKEALEYIMDIFTGADGGIGFVHLKSFIENLSRQADNDDYQSQKVLDITLHTFKRFIELAQTQGEQNSGRKE